MSFTFGKYKGRSFDDIKMSDPEYIQYIAQNYGSDFVEVLEYAKFNNLLDAVFMPFGKYKNVTIDEVIKKDNKYMAWIVKKLQEKEEMTKSGQKVVDAYLSKCANSVL